MTKNDPTTALIVLAPSIVLADQTPGMCQTQPRASEISRSGKVTMFFDLYSYLLQIVQNNKMRVIITQKIA